MRLIKILLVLIILGFAALVGFAYLGDFTPENGELSLPVQVPGSGNAN